MCAGGSSDAMRPRPGPLMTASDPVSARPATAPVRPTGTGSSAASRACDVPLHPAEASTTRAGCRGRRGRRKARAVQPLRRPTPAPRCVDAREEPEHRVDGRRDRRLRDARHGDAVAFGFNHAPRDRRRCRCTGGRAGMLEPRAGGNVPRRICRSIDESTLKRPSVIGVRASQRP